MKPIGSKDRELVAEITTEFGKVLLNSAVFEALIGQVIGEVPGVTNIKLRQLFKKPKNQNVSIATGDAADHVTLQVEVWLQGPVNVIEVGSQIQKRLKYDIEQCLAVQVEEVNLTIANIVFE